MSRDKARSFMFVCIGIAALVAAFNFGASTAVGQATGGGTGIVSSHVFSGYNFVLLENGDIWKWGDGTRPLYFFNFYEATGVVPSSTTTLGDVKANFR